ncbi:hypothetical protein [uncultured Corynebacterium sp.]|uniref:hypothetical protein n=1 Tax=uncultured Corynebacterium sp. TaxID=159447 RepID=UPI0025D363C1|nr:hypothetical protein [uncultured Corynebacterium sp.]
MIPVWLLVVVLLVAVVAVLGIWLSGTASRLNRLHIRTDSARLNLEGALQARGAVIGVLRPDLQQAAARAGGVALRAEEMGARSDAENALVRTLTVGERTNPAFVEASTKVDLAARFYNDAVGDTLGLRSRPVVRMFRLAGSAPLPAYYDAMSGGDGTQ